MIVVDPGGHAISTFCFFFPKVLGCLWCQASLSQTGDEGLNYLGRVNHRCCLSGLIRGKQCIKRPIQAVNKTKQPNIQSLTMILLSEINS